MPFGKDIQRKIENALYDYDNLPDNILKKHINLALEYFKKRPHKVVMTDFYFVAKKDKYRKKGYYYMRLYDKLGFEERQIQRIKKDIVTRIIITLAVNGYFEI